MASLKKKSNDGIVGLYLPLIFEACQEDQFAYEYRHGVTCHGAFAYSLRNQKSLTFQTLFHETKTRLRKLGYDREPNVLGPSAIMGAKIPGPDRTTAEMKTPRPSGHGQSSIRADQFSAASVIAWVHAPFGATVITGSDPPANSVSTVRR